MKMDSWREQTSLLHRYDDGTEVRVEFDDEGGLVVWWFEPLGEGAFQSDLGAKIPKQALGRLAELLVDKL